MYVDSASCVGTVHVSTTCASRAELVSSFSFLCPELCVSACASRVEHVLFACASRAERASLFSFTCQELSLCLHVPRELSVSVHVSAFIEG